jgi:hypothetical protein
VSDRVENEHVRKFIKIAAIIAAANLLLFWIAFGLLMAGWPDRGLSQFLGFSPPPPVPSWLPFALWAFIVLGAPGSIVLDGTGHDLLLLILTSMFNCVLWGLILGFPVYKLTRRFGSHAARPV